MTSISALENIFKKGLFGDYEDKNENQLIKIQLTLLAFVLMAPLRFVQGQDLGPMQSATLRLDLKPTHHI